MLLLTVRGLHARAVADELLGGSVAPACARQRRKWSRDHKRARARWQMRMCCCE